MDCEATQVAARHFVRLPIDRQQQGATARSPDYGGKYFLQANVWVNDEKTTTIARVAACRESARLPIDRQQRGRRRSNKKSSLAPADDEKPITFCQGTIELFNDWEGRGYDDSVLGEVTKTPSSGDRTT